MLARAVRKLCFPAALGPLTPGRPLLAQRKIPPSVARTRYRTQYRPQQKPRILNSTSRLHAAALWPRIREYCCASYPSGEQRVNANRFATRSEVP